MIKYQAVLFDMDGTIVNSSAAVKRQWRLWAEEHLLDVDQVLRIMQGRRAVEVMQLVAPHLPQPESTERFLAKEALDTDGIFAIPGALDFIKTLKSWAVVTSATQSIARSRMRAAGLPDPGVLIGADMVINGKPDPECFLRAAELLNIDPVHCLVFEDAPAGVQAARAARMGCIGLTTHHTADELGVDVAIADFRNHIELLSPLLD